MLQSQIVGPYTSPVCFGFWHYIYTEDNAIYDKLIVSYTAPSSGKQNKLGTVKDSSIKAWQYFNVTVQNIPKGRFQLQTIQQRFGKADVAIDDIAITQGGCGSSVPTIPSTVTQDSNCM